MIIKKFLFATAFAVISTISMAESVFAPKHHFQLDTPSIEIIQMKTPSESVLAYDGGLLISNIGKPLGSRATGNLGYISYLKNGQNTVLIPAHSHLKEPTAMAVKGHYLFVCDLDSVKVFDLNQPAVAPQIIRFPQGNNVVNDMVLVDDTLFVTVTDSGAIYRLDVKNPAIIHTQQPQLLLKLAGANGIVHDGKMLYVVSIPADYQTVIEKNVIYRISDLDAPKAQAITSRAGVYDGLQLSEDGKWLFASDWKTSSLIAVNVDSGVAQDIYQEKGIGIADFLYQNRTFYLPDMPNNRIIKLPLILSVDTQNQ